MNRILLIVALTWVISGSAFAITVRGQEHGSGGDIPPPEEGSAWFVGGDKTITACMNWSPAFGISKEAFYDIIERSIETWHIYYRTKGGGDQIPFDHWPTLTLGTIIPGCQGDEDLAFYLGTTSAEVEAAKKSFSRPFALAKRTSYDVKKGWGKGFIWIASPQEIPELHWTNPILLQGALLHELGHVFGCAHVSKTIMTEDLYDVMKGEDEYRLTHIDHQRSLMLPRPDQYQYEGSMSPSGSDYYTSFRDLTGTDPVGGVSGKVVRDVNGLQVSLHDQGATSVYIRVQLDLDGLFNYYTPTNWDIFKTVISAAPPYPNMEAWSSDSYVEMGMAEVEGKEKKFPVVIERNMDNQVAIKYFGPNGGRDLFYSDVPWPFRGLRK
jgi:hypothetical protein